MCTQRSIYKDFHFSTDCNSKTGITKVYIHQEMLNYNTMIRSTESHKEYKRSEAGENI